MLNDKINDPYGKADRMYEVNKEMVNDKMVNIFERVQKKTPYQVPVNYFAHSKSRLRPSSHRRWYWGIAATLVLVAGIWSLIRITSPSTPTPDPMVYSVTPTDDWSNFAEADLFLENMNW